MTQGATGSALVARTGLDRIATLCALFLLLGPVVVSRIGQPGVLNPGTGVNTFFEQYRRHEPVFLVLLAAFAITCAVAARRASLTQSSADSMATDSSWRSSTRLALVAAIVFVVAAIGTWLVMHAFPLSMDEYVASFQAGLFSSGKLAARIPEPWSRFAWSMTPVFVSYDANHQVWVSQYLPVYSMLRAPFVGIGADRLLNPALAAASIPLLYVCARRLWPDDTRRAWLAVAFLALSSQLLFMSMSGYAMPAHLAANLLWLYAFLRRDRAGWVVAPLIGGVALGLHNPFPHALFVAPFLLYVAWQRRWGWTAYFAVVYLAGIAFWLWWGKSVQMASGGSLVGLFQMPGLLMLEVQGLSLTLMMSWQTPLMAIALLCATMTWRTLGTMERLLAAGIALSFGFFFLFPSTQGHGWGYRYTYPVLGNMALLAAVGLENLRTTLGTVFVRRALIASAAVTVFVQVPVRAWQVEGYVRPFWRAHEYVAQLDADVVIVDPTTSWYGIDLVRNDPFFNAKPRIVSAFGLRPEQKRELATLYGKRVHLLEPAELAPFGIPIFPSRFRSAVWPPDPAILGPLR